MRKLTVIYNISIIRIYVLMEVETFKLDYNGR